MYIKRILILIAGIGLIFMGSFAFYVYKVMFMSNTSFENDYVHIYIKTGTTIDGTSHVYFIQEVESEQYELIFGDGIFGKSLEDGNVIEVSYIVTNGDSANGVSRLVFSGRLTYTRNSI